MPTCHISLHCTCPPPKTSMPKTAVGSERLYFCRALLTMYHNCHSEVDRLLVRPLPPPEFHPQSTSSDASKDALVRCAGAHGPRPAFWRIRRLSTTTSPGRAQPRINNKPPTACVSPTFSALSDPNFQPNPTPPQAISMPSHADAIRTGQASSALCNPQLAVVTCARPGAALTFAVVSASREDTP